MKKFFGKLPVMITFVALAVVMAAIHARTVAVMIAILRCGFINLFIQHN